MHIRDTRKCNIMNLHSLAGFLRVDPKLVLKFYEDLRSDAKFLAGVNRRIAKVRNTAGFKKGIFKKERIASVDWFAFERVLIYVLIRLRKPKYVLETGVFYGGNSAFALLALKHNKSGKMISIDYPDSQIRSKGASKGRHKLVGYSELYTTELRPGFMVPDELRSLWTLIEGDSLKIIPTLKQKFDFYIHDSDHSMQFLSKELAAAWSKLSRNAVVLVDDIDWSNAFYKFCSDQRLFPLLLTDNGKDDLRVRTGLIDRSHPRNSDPSFT